MGLDEQSFEPPPQLGTPEDPIRDAPIIRITVPVTIGGKIFFRIRGETNDMKISRKEQIKDVPIRIHSIQYPKVIQHGEGRDLPSTFP